MKCAYHPNREAVDSCYTCKRPICAECKAVLGDRVICRRCIPIIYERVRTELNKSEEEQSGERIFNYILPIGAISLSILFFILFSLAGMKEVMFIPGALLAIGIILLIIILAIERKMSKRQRKVSKLTHKKLTGWILFCGGVLYFVIGIPTIATLFHLGIIFIVSSIVISIVVGIIGGMMTKP